MKLYFQDKTWCLSGNQDLSLYEGEPSFKKSLIVEQFQGNYLKNVFSFRSQKVKECSASAPKEDVLIKKKMFKLIG